MNSDAIQEQPIISLVIPCFNEAEVFPLLRKELTGLADLLSPRYRTEFVLIDDGSSDSTWSQMISFASEDARVVAASLSRNFGHQAALTCGYDLASGDAMVSLDGDLQDPPEAVVDMVREWEKGADVVFAVRDHREGETPFKLWTAALFYRVIKALTQGSAPEDAGDFRLMSRPAVDALRSLRETHRYLRGMAGWIGFQTATIHYRRRARPVGVTKWPLHRMIRFAADAIVSFTMLPLRLAYWMAAWVGLLFTGYLGYAVVRYIFYQESIVTGWSSLLGAVIVIGLCNLLCLGIVGEYVGRIYEQSKGRPLYLMRQVYKNSRATLRHNGK